MDVNFKELLEDERCRLPLEEFNTKLELNCHAWDTLGRPILPPIWGNTLCKAIKSVQPGLLTCAGSHKEMTKEAKSTNRPVIRKCHAGLVKAVVPVVVDGRYIGLLGGCGSLSTGDKLDHEYLRELASKIGIAAEELLSHVPSVNEVDVEALEKKVEEVLKAVEKAAKAPA